MKSILIQETAKMLHNEIGYTFLKDLEGNIKILSKYSKKDLENLWKKLTFFQLQKSSFKTIVVGKSNDYSVYKKHQEEYNKIFEKVITNLKDSSKTLKSINNAYSKSTKSLNLVLKGQN